MHSIDLPAGTPVRLTATAPAGKDLHRWGIEVPAAENGSVRMGYGSHIGGLDVDQRIDIPAQAEDCRLEIRCHHATSDGWAEDRAHTGGQDTPNSLEIGFYNAARPGDRHDEVLLCFAFGRPRTNVAAD